MARNKTPHESNLPLELLVTQESARQRLFERVVKGRDILVIPIRSTLDIENVRQEYYRWDDYNTKLLEMLFSSKDMADEYNGSDMSFFTIGDPNFSNTIDDLHKDVKKHINRIESIMDRLELIPVSASVTSTPVTSNSVKAMDKNKIFIVHGRDDVAKLEVARFIEKLGFEPVILHEQASSSKTIIEKIETYTDVGFGVVIYTPCDMGALSSDAVNQQGRARQNVVFEHGYLMGKLGRDKVCALVKGKVETPNDITGIVYTSMESAQWHIDLAKELKAAGYIVDMNKIF